MDAAAIVLTDEQAVKAPRIYPTWAAGLSVKAGDRLYMCQRTGEAAGGTVVLQYMPHELVGHYFVEVT